MVVRRQLLIAEHHDAVRIQPRVTDGDEAVIVQIGGKVRPDHLGP